MSGVALAADGYGLAVRVRQLVRANAGADEGKGGKLMLWWILVILLIVVLVTLLSRVL
jgi:hypothetical protein